MFMTAVGLAVGSFLNVVIYRLPLGQSVMRPTLSHCPACGAGIRWHDNLPVISYLRLGGRCRDCRSGISVRYPIIEMLCGLLFLMLV
ncbi:MAG: prepilin peptidase, partial [Planctomycetes bacterium]|nr:prepilin peptidase [Planctomycetota bacterium]